MFIAGLDVLLFIALIFSGGLAYSRGFMREILAIGTWILAGLFTRVGAETLSPIMANMFGTSSVVGSIISYIIVFVFGIFVASFIIKKLATKLHETDFKSADKSLGFIFGLARGFLLVSGVYIGVLWFFPQENERPHWVVNSRSRPLLRQGAVLIDSLFIPNTIPSLKADLELAKTDKETYKNLLKPAIEKETVEEKTDENVGYSNNERQDLNLQLRQIREMQKLH